MKVEELISRLKAMPSDADVVFHDAEDFTDAQYAEVIRSVKYDRDSGRVELEFLY